MIEIRHLDCGYDQTIVKDVNLNIEKGHVLVLLGQNGCGKTTLLKTIAGLVEPKGGELFLEGKRYEGISARSISILLQSHNIPDMSVEGLVEHGRYPYLHFPRQLSENDRKKIEWAIEKAGISSYRHKNMMKISGGERQKAYIAMCLAQDSDYVLLDEPTVYLDIRYQLEILKLIDEMKQMNKAIVMVSHDIEQALACADEICLFDHGNIEYYNHVSNPELLRRIEEVYDIRITKVDTADGACYQYRLKYK